MKARPEFVRYAAYAHGGTDTFVALVDERSMAQRIVGLPNSYPEELRVPASHTALAQGPAYVPVGRIRRDLSEGRWLRMGMAQLGEPSDRIGSGDLAPDAANLPTVLADLPPPVLGEIRADLVALVPGIASFDVVPDGDEMRIDFELSGGDRMPARLVSDGTLRILVLLTALRLEPRPALICIEEPENGIYPGRLRALLELFRSEAQRRHDDPEALAQLEALVRFDADGIGHHGLVGVSHNFLPTQILLTTHSPVILAALRKHPEHLRFVDAVRRDGHRFTRVRSVGKPVPGDLGRFTIAPREIDLLLNAAQSEEPA
ncbi:MAG: ATP-binding protein [Nannocystis sp.]|uniref:AAA family ATPase n=1 Tax=Nannocystis sp. TaxID=1962667 RepID=UPI002421066A|nr:ATP-binding protein [Nannocystis sp.]MBK9755287.1 ATP-binding protein [Nannocystis sp.]